MNKITINGKTYLSSGNISIVNGTVIMDSEKFSTDEKIINISIEGDMNTLEVDCCDKVSIKGEVGRVSTVSGDIECGNVNGGISSVSGDVRCGNVGGSISTVSGDVKHVK